MFCFCLIIVLQQNYVPVSVSTKLHLKSLGMPHCHTWKLTFYRDIIVSYGNLDFFTFEVFFVFYGRSSRKLVGGVERILCNNVCSRSCSFVSVTLVCSVGKLWDFRKPYITCYTGNTCGDYSFNPCNRYRYHPASLLLTSMVFRF